MTQRIFLSSTCLDLVDLRSGLKESLEEMGYQVWASEFPDFPVDSRLHAQDNCLHNVEQADQYVLIVNDRYGAAYGGTAYPVHPVPEYPKRRVSVTWYEYLRAFQLGKPIRILVRESIWDQRGVFQATRKSGADLAGTGLSPELFDFLDFVCSREKANWIHHFRECPKPNAFSTNGWGRTKRRTPGSSSAKCASYCCWGASAGWMRSPARSAISWRKPAMPRCPTQWAVRCVFQKHRQATKLERSCQIHQGRKRGGGHQEPQDGSREA
jgi:hypothetical protein